MFGLRRALVLAGVESQLMSLWNVADVATRDLMVAYYTRVTNGEGRAEALRNVQLEMLSGSEYEHPFNWASFIQSGNWEPLDARRARESTPAPSNPAASGAAMPSSQPVCSIAVPTNVTAIPT